MALASSFRPSMPGHETATRPWSAPVGHPPAAAADVPIGHSLSLIKKMRTLTARSVAFAEAAKTPREYPDSGLSLCLRRTCAVPRNSSGAR